MPRRDGIRSALRSLGRAFPAARSGWYLALELRAIAGATPDKQRTRYEDLFKQENDPWSYASAAQRRRLARELHMVLDASGSGCFRSALEIGCAEGAFTEMLAPHCESLLAVDFSRIALDRAQALRRWPDSVRFVEMDLLTARLPATCDLIVAVDVLDDLALPWRMRSLRNRIVAALEPGGLLLVGNPRANGVIENANWGRWMVRGGVWIDRYFGAHPGLERIASEQSNRRIDSVFRRRRAC